MRVNICTYIIHTHTRTHTHTQVPYLNEMAAEHEDEDEVLIDNKKRKINKRLEKMHEMAAEHEVEDEVLIDNNNKKKIKKYTRWRRSTRTRTRSSQRCILESTLYRDLP